MNKYRNKYDSLWSRSNSIRFVSSFISAGQMTARAPGQLNDLTRGCGAELMCGVKRRSRQESDGVICGKEMGLDLGSHRTSLTSIGADTDQKGLADGGYLFALVPPSITSPPSWSGPLSTPGKSAFNLIRGKAFPCSEEEPG